VRFLESRHRFAPRDERQEGTPQGGSVLSHQDLPPGVGIFGVVINYARSKVRFAPGKGQRTESGTQVKVRPLTRRRRARAGCTNSPARCRILEHMYEKYPERGVRGFMRGWRDAADLRD